MRSARSLLMVCALALALVIPSSARAQPTNLPLLVFVSPSRGDLERGETVTFTISAYSDATEPTTATLTLHPSAGLDLVGAPQWGASTLWQDHPLTINVRYRVADTAPTHGAYLPFTVVLTDSRAQQRSASTAVRVGTFLWPPARFVFMRYMPLVAR